MQEKDWPVFHPFPLAMNKKLYIAKPQKAFAGK
jgi:hypothetical protein